MRKLIWNSGICPYCEDQIESLSVHDCKFCSCGKSMVDGGLEYRHCTSDLEDTSVYSDNDFEILRQFIYRTGYGKPGNPDYGVFRKTILCEMSDNHLQAAIDYIIHGRIVLANSNHYLYLVEEKLYRAENEISIPE